jgi:hypothetical protein
MQSVRAVRDAVRDNGAGTLAHDLAVLEQLVYKNYNQHRRGIYFRHLQGVKSRFARLGRFASILRSLDDLGAAASATSGPAPASLDAAVTTFLAQCQELFDATVATLQCARHFLNLIVSGYFLPFALTGTAVLSRLFVLSRRALEHLATVPPMVDSRLVPSQQLAVRTTHVAWMQCLRYGRMRSTQHVHVPFSLTTITLC